MLTMEFQKNQEEEELLEGLSTNKKGVGTKLVRIEEVRKTGVRGFVKGREIKRRKVARGQRSGVDKKNCQAKGEVFT